MAQLGAHQHSSNKQQPRPQSRASQHGVESKNRKDLAKLLLTDKLAGGGEGMPIP